MAKEMASEQAYRQGICPERAFLQEINPWEGSYSRRQEVLRSQIKLAEEF